MWKPIFRLLTELSSRPAIARTAGKFAKSPASRRLIRRFAAVYRIDLGEAERPAEQYGSLNEFFIRRLKEGARPIDESASAVISPVDGTIAETGAIDEECMFLVKGQRYTADELLGDAARAARYRGGGFAVIYLSPANYHRIHAPVSGKVAGVVRLPGTVYPVNDPSLRHMRRVLSRNVRVVTYFKWAGGEMALVKVGAMNVGSIRFAAGDAPPPEVAKGDELAYFEFGSTVVLLWERGALALRADLAPGTPVRMGEKIGEAAPAKS
mgnify:CR=1 FL=1